MASMNKVLLMGNLTRDPELRNTSSGQAVANFGLAMNRRFRTSQGEDREETCFVDIEAWGRQGETCARYLRKGSPALVEGRLRYDQWEDRESGQKRSRLLVRANRVQFLGSSRTDDTPGGGQQARQAREPQAEYGPGSAPPSAPNRGDAGQADGGDTNDDIPF